MMASTQVGFRWTQPSRRFLYIALGAIIGAVTVVGFRQITEPEPAPYVAPPPRQYLVDTRQVDFYEELRLTPMASRQAPSGWRVERRSAPPQRMYASIARDEAGMPIGGASQNLRNPDRQLWGVISFGVFHSRPDAVAGFYERRAEQLNQYELASAEVNQRFFSLDESDRPTFCSRTQTPDLSDVDGIHCDALSGNVVLGAEVNGGQAEFPGSPRLAEVRALLDAALAHLRFVRAE